MSGLSAWLGAVPVQPDRGTARDWAVQELTRQEYQDAQPGLGERALRWLWDLINRAELGGSAPPVPALILISVVVAAVIFYAVRRSGGLHRTARRKSAAVLPVTATTAADHRAAAERHAQAEQWDLAVVERFRAIARELEERALLSPQPGRTAREVARDGGSALPDLGPDLLRAADWFDEVSYGHRSVGAPAEQAVRTLDERVRTARAVPVA
jgi:hypothetical protein